MFAGMTVLIAVVCMGLVVTGVILLLVMLSRQDRQSKDTAASNPGYPVRSHEQQPTQQQPGAGGPPPPQ